MLKKKRKKNHAHANAKWKIFIYKLNKYYMVFIKIFYKFKSKFDS